MLPISGEAFRRLMNDDALWRTHRPNPLWMDDEVLYVMRPRTPDQGWQRLSPQAYDTLPDDAVVRIDSGFVASRQGYHGELTDLVLAWQDQERRRIEANNLREHLDALSVKGTGQPVPSRRRL